MESNLASSQANVFDWVGLPLVTDLVQGRNGLFFSYGVMGSGKTHTMQGTSKDREIMARLVVMVVTSI